jgi:hypothetical protein
MGNITFLYISVLTLQDNWETELPQLSSGQHMQALKAVTMKHTRDVAVQSCQILQTLRRNILSQFYVDKWAIADSFRCVLLENEVGDTEQTITRLHGRHIAEGSIFF